MKKLIALIIVLLVFVLSLTRCSNIKFVSGDSYLNFEFRKDINAKLSSDTVIFSKDDVTMDFLYSFYCLNNTTLDQAKDNGRINPSQNDKYRSNLESVYAIYLSKNQNLVFEEDEFGALIDYEKKVNAQLLKFINYEDAFNTNYGYTSSQLKITYNHSEDITIPAELFDSTNGFIYIHLINLVHDIDNNKYYNDNVFDFNNTSTLKMQYYSIGDVVVIV